MVPENELKSKKLNSGSTTDNGIISIDFLLFEDN